MRLVAIRRLPTFSWAVAVFPHGRAKRPLVVARFTRADGCGAGVVVGAGVGVAPGCGLGVAPGPGVGLAVGTGVGPGVTRVASSSMPARLLDDTVLKPRSSSPEATAVPETVPAVASVCVHVYVQLSSLLSRSSPPGCASTGVQSASLIVDVPDRARVGAAGVAQRVRVGDRQRRGPDARGRGAAQLEVAAGGRLAVTRQRCRCRGEHGPAVDPAARAWRPRSDELPCGRGEQPRAAVAPRLAVVELAVRVRVAARASAAGQLVCWITRRVHRHVGRAGVRDHELVGGRERREARQRGRAEGEAEPRLRRRRGAVLVHAHLAVGGRVCSTPGALDPRGDRGDARVDRHRVGHAADRRRTASRREAPAAHGSGMLHERAGRRPVGRREPHRQAGGGHVARARRPGWTPTRCT